MNRKLLAGVLIALSSAALAAQQAAQQNPYQGTSNPPADDTIVTDAAAQPKPPAAHPMVTPSAAPAPDPQQPAPDPAAAAPAADQTLNQSQAQPLSARAQSAPAANDPAAADAGIVATASPESAPALPPAPYAADPDGDIVHPRVLGPGEIGEGTTISVRLLDRLSTALTEKGEPFHSQVAYDVMAGGQVLIPAGSEIDGTVVQVSSGHAGGAGSMRLRPETLMLANGERFQFFAEVTGAPGSNTHVVGEGTIKPDSRLKRDGIEYGGAVGAGVITGAVMAGPVGALTGGLIGAGVITTHLLVSHPQATLDPGTTLLFTLTEPLQMTLSTPSGN
jgi:hypothetical protein